MTLEESCDEMHYVLTIQWSVTVGMKVATTEGRIRPDGRTRQQLYLFLFDQLVERHQAAGPACTLFFSLEPNGFALEVTE